MRHPTEIQIAFTTPTRPVVLRNGEKANERSVGAVVLLIREQMPKIAPRIAPADGPKRIAPMITGMCTVHTKNRNNKHHYQNRNLQCNV